MLNYLFFYLLISNIVKGQIHLFLYVKNLYEIIYLFIYLFIRKSFLNVF